jgi:fructosamine-3-kinase
VVAAAVLLTAGFLGYVYVAVEVVTANAADDAAVGKAQRAFFIYAKLVLWKGLLPQLALARARGFEAVATRGELVSHRLDELLGHVPEPALLHGDLWGGNWAVDELGQPVVFDPAVYFGDRETDLAMTRLFGGFDAEFYAAYERAWPLPVGWPDRLPAYQLYHVLNHLNLFGGGYLGQANSLLEQLERTI